MSTEERTYMTALEHVQEDNAEAYAEYLQENNKIPSEESALRFLEEVEEAFNISEANYPHRW